MRRSLTFFLTLVLCHVSASSQLRITKTERLPLDTSREWSSPKFSPDGSSIFFTTQSYHGIWQFSFRTQQQINITADPRSGFGFEISPDGKTIAYRRTVTEDGYGGRIQEVVTKTLSTGQSESLGSGNNLSTPVFIGAAVIFTDNVTTQNLNAAAMQSGPKVLGIENTKIALLVDGGKRLLDPLKGGSYIWPSLSPDGKKLVATDMAKGAFICDLRGRVLVRLGQRNGAVWSRDGRWLIYMKDKDDGHNITGSDLYCVSADGKTTRRLTSTENVVELYPQTSPVENKIVCSTLDGTILVMTYVEVGR